MSEVTRFRDRFQIENGQHWLFAYGSLIFRPGFAAEERVRAELRGHARRFWQGSPDHRGTREAPGRVVTLVEAAGETCLGVAYRLPARGSAELWKELDLREQAGFERVQVELHSAEYGQFSAVTYVARAHNPHFLGAAPLAELARQVAARSGPSGSNAEYVRRLAAALRELAIDDVHVFELEAALDALSLEGDGATARRRA